MATRTTWGLRESIKNGWPLAVLAAIDHPDGLVRVWSKTGDLVYDGDTYEGLGRFGAITNIGAAKRITVRDIKFRLRGVPAEATVWLSADVRNRSAQAWLAGLNARGSAVNGTPWLVVDGLCDYQTLQVAQDRTATIELTVREPVFLIDRAQFRMWTAEQIREDHGSTISGLDKISAMIDSNHPWTPT